MKKGFIQRRKRVMPAGIEGGLSNGQAIYTSEGPVIVDPELKAQQEGRRAGPMPVDFTSFRTGGSEAQSHNNRTYPNPADLTAPYTFKEDLPRQDRSPDTEPVPNDADETEEKRKRKRAKRENLAAQIARMQQEMEEMDSEEDEARIANGNGRMAGAEHIRT